MDLKTFLSKNRNNLYGLHFGINDYLLSPLNGCVNDAKNISSFCVDKLGFEAKNCKLFIDHECTRTNVLTSIQEVIETAKDEDSILISYSGHGSQLPAINTSSEVDDGVDEVLVTYIKDGQTWWEDCIIRDDDIAAILKKANPHTRVVFILDCCHTGTGTRTLGDPFARRDSRYLIPPKNIIQDIYKIEKDNYWKIYTSKEQEINERNVLTSFFTRLFRRPVDINNLPNLRPIHIESNEVLFSGCLSFETSEDVFINNSYQGAMTAALIESLLYLDDYIFSYKKLYINLIRCLLKNSGGVLKQHPQLEINREFLNNPFML